MDRWIGWLILAVVWTVPAAAVERKIVFAADFSDPAIGEAATQASGEALRQAQFLGIDYEMVLAPIDQATSHGDAHAVLVAGSADQAEQIAAKMPGVAVFNVLSRDDAVRARCRANLFHIAPSKMMLAAAEAQWRKASPEAKKVEARAWHEDFVKFAGRELNNRWQKGTGRPMTDEDWAIWAAYRLVADAIAQNPEATPGELIEYMRGEMEFDGQKGLYLTFRETGQLRQPLMLVVDGKLAGEAPVRGVADSEDLDSLGPQQCAQ